MNFHIMRNINQGITTVQAARLNPAIDGGV